MKNILKLALVAFLTITPLFNSSIKAAGMGMGMGTPCGGPFPPCPVPLDSNIIFLLIAGAVLGGYKLYISYKKNPA